MLGFVNFSKPVDSERLPVSHLCPSSEGCPAWREVAEAGRLSGKRGGTQGCNKAAKYESPKRDRKQRDPAPCVQSLCPMPRGETEVGACGAGSDDHPGSPHAAPAGPGLLFHCQLLLVSKLEKTKAKDINTDGLCAAAPRGQPRASSGARGSPPMSTAAVMTVTRRSPRAQHHIPSRPRTDSSGQVGPHNSPAR